MAICSSGAGTRPAEKQRSLRTEELYTLCALVAATIPALSSPSPCVFQASAARAHSPAPHRSALGAARMSSLSNAHGLRSRPSPFKAQPPHATSTPGRAHSVLARSEHGAAVAAAVAAAAVASPPRRHTVH